MQKNINRSLQHSSMIHKIHNEKNLRSRQCVGREIWGRKAQKWGMV